MHPADLLGGLFQQQRRPAVARGWLGEGVGELRARHMGRHRPPPAMFSAQCIKLQSGILKSPLSSASHGASSRAAFVFCPCWTWMKLQLFARLTAARADCWRSCGRDHWRVERGPHPGRCRGRRGRTGRVDYHPERPRRPGECCAGVTASDAQDAPCSPSERPHRPGEAGPPVC